MRARERRRALAFGSFARNGLIGARLGAPAVGADGRDSPDVGRGLPLDGRAPAGGRGSGGVIGAPRNDGFVGGMAGVTRCGSPGARGVGDTAVPPLAGVAIVGRGGNNVERGDGVVPEIDAGRGAVGGSAASRSTAGAGVPPAAGAALVGGSRRVSGGGAEEGAAVKGFVVRGGSGAGEGACDGSSAGAPDGGVGGIA